MGRVEQPADLDNDPVAMTHGSKLEQLEAAFKALGKRLAVDVEDVPVPLRRGRRVVKKTGWAGTNRRERHA